MAEAILCGLQSSGHPSSYLRYSEPFEQRLEYMQTKYPDMIGSNKNKEVIDGADVIVLAVKPQILHTVVTELGSLIEHNPEVLVLSIAAGITTEDIQAWIHAPFSPCIVRCMPNTPALIGEGAVGLYATEHVSHEQKKMTEDIMKAVSKQVIWVHEESLIDAVTGISGSGPAYFFLIMEAMQNAGIQAGLSSKDAKALTLQTCLGAARMAQISEDDLSTLRCKVTSPKGTTEAAIHSMESNQIRKVMSEAVFSAKRRSKELAEQIGKEL
ncbi:pyrroline-5-carboxylate reductase [Cokeromyces recurvatus]|uniref:pyrroline-5-carboxylate reductase n=1 Tax=Cokeromyces recurvatus TaxID=90255 RepID=UPI0022200B6E|nr:pyrroline-5-carboxylate reductase [Cokeromyces recurvatus]KAI7901783.1 pyrroline-5-carboxylate reductase [Cokeromyces recurvatus]